MVLDGNATVYIDGMDKAVAFYTEVLGMQLAERYGDDWATVKAGGLTIGLHPSGEKSPAPGTAGSINVGLLVDDIQAAHATLSQHDGLHVENIVDGSGGRFVNFHDPFGNHLYFWQMPKW